jgi:hypothetical protein
MKKKSFKTTLALKKNTISNLAKVEAIGGSRGCSQTMCGSCSCPEACFPGPAPTKDGGSWCKCL